MACKAAALNNIVRMHFWGINLSNPCGHRGEVMFEAIREYGIAAVIGTALMAGALSGCASMMPGSHVDCNVVKLQQQSGRSDSEIAAAIGASQADVSACAAGPEKSSNKTTGGVPDTY